MKNFLLNKNREETVDESWIFKLENDAMRKFMKDKTQDTFIS